MAVQAQAPEGQVISARLLPEGDQPVEARPVLEEVEKVEEEATAAA